MGWADGGLRNGRVTTVAAEQVGSCEHQHWTKSNGREVKHPSASLALLTSCVSFPKYFILFEARFPYLQTSNN